MKTKEMIFATSTDYAFTLDNKDNILLSVAFNGKTTATAKADDRLELWDDRKKKDGTTRYFLFVGRNVSHLFKALATEKGARVVSKGREVKLIGEPKDVLPIVAKLVAIDRNTVNCEVVDSMEALQGATAKKTTAEVEVVA